MEVKNVPLKDIKIDPLAEELSNSEEARPYVDYFTRSISGDAAGVEAALQALRELALENDMPRGYFPRSSGHLQTSRARL